MHVLKWWMQSTRMVFDENNSSSGGSDGSGSASSGSSAAPGGGDAGGGSTPATPDGGGSPPSSPDPSPSPEAGASSGDMDWSQIGSTEDLDNIEVPAAPPPPAAPPKKYGAAATPEPGATPPPAQPVVPPAPVTPPAPAAPPAAPTQPAPQEAPAPAVQLSPSDPLGIATALEANRDAAIAHLAQSRFALTQEDIAELEDNAAAFVPKMMARVHHETQVSMMKFLAQAVPGMMKQFNTVTTANNAAEDQFFSAHQQLGLNKADPNHRAAAFRMAKIYRQANPDMPLEQLIADVGPMVAMSLKLPLVPQSGQPPGTPQPAPTGARPTGFRPAVNGGGGATPAPVAPDEWSGMGQEYDNG